MLISIYARKSASHHVHINSQIITILLSRHYYYSHFTDEKLRLKVVSVEFTQLLNT